jgi:excisionase family DNA binding protein
MIKRGFTKTGERQPLASHVAAVQPRYAPYDDWCRLSGLGLTTTRELIAAGELKAIKVGKRTLVDVEFGLAWLANRPSAVAVRKRAA